LTSTDLQTRRARCQHQLSFLFKAPIQVSGTSIVECLEIIESNLKQFGGLT